MSHVYQGSHFCWCLVGVRLVDVNVNVVVALLYWLPKCQCRVTFDWSTYLWSHISSHRFLNESLYRLRRLTWCCCSEMWIYPHPTHFLTVLVILNKCLSFTETDMEWWCTPATVETILYFCTIVCLLNGSLYCLLPWTLVFMSPAPNWP